MREIKFRAYCSLTKTMIDDYCVLKDNEFIGYDMTNNTHYIEAVMQFTGLKDKNGREIYEGDILKYSNQDDHHTKFSRLYVVEFGEQDLGHSSYQQTIGWNATPIHRYNKDSGMDSGRLSNGILDLFGSHKVEIIGNIHENGELLK